MIQLDPQSIDGRQAALDRLRRFWDWVRAAPDGATSRGLREVDPCGIVAGSKALLPPSTQVHLWGEMRYPKPPRWTHAVDDWRNHGVLEPALLLSTRSGWVVSEGNHRVLFARQRGLVRMQAEILIPRYDPGTALEEVLELFRWPAGMPTPAPFLPAPPAPEDAERARERWESLAESWGQERPAPEPELLEAIGGILARAARAWVADVPGGAAEDGALAAEAERFLVARLLAAHGIGALPGLAPADGEPTARGAPAAVLARRALARLENERRGELRAALDAVAELGRRAEVDPADPGSAPFRGWRPRHPTGFGPGPAGETCRSCAWSEWIEEDVWSCRQARPVRDVDAVPWLRPDWEACARWEPRLGPGDCLACGACCRSEHPTVDVRPDEAAALALPELHTHRADGSIFLDQPGGRCVALEEAGDGTWPCRIFDRRPRVCQVYEVGGKNCLFARRAVGLTD